MRAYGLCSKIRHSGRKVAWHTRRGGTCQICNNYKTNKTSARMKAKLKIKLPTYK